MLFIQVIVGFSIINKYYIEVGLKLRSDTSAAFEYKASAKLVAVCFHTTKIWWGAHFMDFPVVEYLYFL